MKNERFSYKIRNATVSSIGETLSIGHNYLILINFYTGGEGMQFSEKLKQLRIKSEYSQEQLAELLNVSRQAVTKWENGNGMPDIENLKAISNLFDVTLDSLLHDEEEVESTDEHFCWKLCGAFGVIGLVIGWLLRDLTGANMGAFGIGGGIIGYFIGYVVLEIRKKTK